MRKLNNIQFEYTKNHYSRIKTGGAFGGPPRRKDLIKRRQNYNKKVVRNLGIPICEWYKYDPNTFKKWKSGKDFAPVY